MSVEAEFIAIVTCKGISLDLDCLFSPIFYHYKYFLSLATLNTKILADFKSGIQE